MTPFYFSQITDNKAILTDDEAKHCQKVLRFKTGDRILGVDGQGRQYLAKITEMGKQLVEAEILETNPGWGEPPVQISLLASPLHKADRFEWLIEKAVELGAARIQPYISKRTVKTGVRLGRLQRIMIAALKQCMRSKLPELDEPIGFFEAIDHVQADLRLIAHAGTGKPISAYAAEFDAAASIAICTGPEGDFAEEELEYALESGFLPVALGENRLRSETATIHLLGLVKHFKGY